MTGGYKEKLAKKGRKRVFGDDNRRAVSLQHLWMARVSPSLRDYREPLCRTENKKILSEKFIFSFQLRVGNTAVPHYNTQKIAVHGSSAPRLHARRRKEPLPVIPSGANREPGGVRLPDGIQVREFRDTIEWR